MLEKLKDNLVDILFYLCLFLLVIMLGNMVFATGPQDLIPKQIGEVFSKAKADSLFGLVTNSKSINKKSLQLMAAGCDNYILVNLVDSIVVVLNERKELLYETPFNYQESDTMHVFSIEKLFKLLSKENDGIVTFQQRDIVFTISKGAFVLEWSNPCPPHCP